MCHPTLLMILPNAWRNFQTQYFGHSKTVFSVLTWSMLKLSASIERLLNIWDYSNAIIVKPMQVNELFQIIRDPLACLLAKYFFVVSDQFSWPFTWFRISDALSSRHWVLKSPWPFLCFRLSKTKYMYIGLLMSTITFYFVQCFILILQGIRTLTIRYR